MYTEIIGENEPPEKSTSYCRLLSLSAVLISPAFLYGFNLSFPTIALPLLDLSVDEASWFGSISLYVSPISSILTGIIIDTYGRKAVLVYGVLPSLVGWSLLLWKRNVTLLLFGQMLNGLTIGAVLVPIQVYAGECIMVHHVRLRNSCMVWIGFYLALGTLVVVSAPLFLRYEQICGFALAVAVAMLIAFFVVVPESPVWLQLRGRTGDAEWSEKKLGIRQSLLRTNAADGNHRVGGTSSSTSDRVSATNVFTRHLRMLRRPDIRKPLVILSVGNAMLPFSGQLAVTTYMIDIIGDTIPGHTTTTATTITTTAFVDISNVTTSSFDANTYGLACAAFSVFGSLVSSMVLPFVGFKYVLIGAQCLNAVAMATLTFCALNVVESVLWLRVVAISVVYFVVGTINGPMFTVGGDMFPVDGKGYSCVPSVLGSLSSATGNKVFPYLYMLCGGYSYCVFVVVSLLGILYAYEMLPEVVGKTLDEINASFLQPPNGKRCT